jgi:hypothetical protein
MQNLPLLNIELIQLRSLNENEPETGMNFQIVEATSGFVAIMEDGVALPFYDDPLHYDILDLLAGRPVSIPTSLPAPTTLLTVSPVFRNRVEALTALRTLGISPLYTGGTGAFPLIATTSLAADTIFYRCLSSATDHRYIAGSLTAGTYLTTSLDHGYANSGFATVGRYALPLPLPASYVRQYELKVGTSIKVGTVAPMYGQAGGGVEVQLPMATSATLISAFSVADY